MVSAVCEARVEASGEHAMARTSLQASGKTTRTTRLDYTCAYTTEMPGCYVNYEVNYRKAEVKERSRTETNFCRP